MAKWEDSNNDIIVLAKHMCSIMTDMTDFIKGRGRIKTTDDVINSAQEISKAGTKLDQLARRIAERCPESSAKSDLLAYLQRIILYCHQLSITSKVRITSLQIIITLKRIIMFMIIIPGESRRPQRLRGTDRLWPRLCY